MLALEAGKHVLCEKAFTVTAAQAVKLVETAKAKKLFLMEGVWTRYFPLSIKIRELVQSGAIGRVYRVTGLSPHSDLPSPANAFSADLSFNNDQPDGTLSWADTHRMVNPNLAGGALLDLGIYPLTWVFQILYHLQPEPKEKPRVQSVISKYSTGVDESTSILVQFPTHKSVGVALTSLRVATDPDTHGMTAPAIRIQGSGGEISVVHPAYKPLQYRIVKKDSGGKVEVVDCPMPKDKDREGWGHGMYWEADECARCVRDGKLESETMPLQESVVMMEVMEKVWRDGGLEYPELITGDVYEEESPLNTGKA
jgi:predicted dehydrogenase